MPLPTTRHQLREYCLRSLGKGVIEINVSPEQVEDRIDEAITIYQKYHYDGAQKYLYKHQVTASTMTFASTPTGTFIVGEGIRGSTSSAQATVVTAASGVVLKFKDVIGTFANGEVVTGLNSGASGTLAASNAAVLGDYDNKYIALPSQILAVEQILPAAGLLQGLFGYKYQAAVDYIRTFIQGDIVSYYVASMYSALLHELFVGRFPFRYNQRTGALHIDVLWKTALNVGQYVVVECYQALDPQTYKSIYSDEFLISYATAVIKRQWGENLSKYEEIALPGGVVVNGEKILNDAKERIATLTDEIKNKYSLPVPLLVG